MILADFVICNNCEKEMYVVMTTEVCPNCMKKGVLSFVDEDNKEVEVDESKVVNLFNIENVINETEMSSDDEDYIDNRPDNIVGCVYCHATFNTEIENYGVSEDNFPVCEKCIKIKE